MDAAINCSGKHTHAQLQLNITSCHEETSDVKICHTLNARVVARSVSKPVYMDQIAANVGCWELDKTLASIRISFISNVNDIILDSTLAVSDFHHGLSRANTPRTAFTTA